MKYYIGIDLGGTNIAGGLVDENGKILKKISIPTEVERGENAIIDNIADLCGKICDESNIKLSQVEKIWNRSTGNGRFRKRNDYVCVQS